jgi:hypothetical protein
MFVFCLRRMVVPRIAPSKEGSVVAYIVLRHPLVKNVPPSLDVYRVVMVHSRANQLKIYGGGCESQEA